jgi:4-amino-4-deoxy-L-arabinose transferase-like glycosyltransferase
MSADRYLTPRRAGELALLAFVLAAAAAARLWHLNAGVPHSVGIDEPQIVDRALRILRTGDWNPHIFDYPTLVIYLQAMVAILRFLWGALNGQWASLDAFSIAAVYSSGRVVAAAIGIATVWLTYRLGLELTSRGIALLAAAQLAVRPLHVRESHFILTDVPMTALTTLAVWLSVRAARLGTMRAYGWAGAACGLAAAAKYHGGIALVAALGAWALHERSSPDRMRKLAAIVGGAALAFLAGAPYTLLDLPGFLDGFAAQFARFAAPAPTGDPIWLIYVKHLSPPGARWSVLVGVAGMLILLWRPVVRVRWTPVILFTLAYFYMLSTHSHVFGRYALPLLPMLFLFIATAVFEIAGAAARVRPAAGRAVRRVVVVAGAILVLYGPSANAVRWLDMQKRSDTRGLAADWLKGNTPRGTRVAVENSGPTYLDAAGFRVVGTEMLLDRRLDWLRERVDYLVISTADPARYGDYLSAGPTVFQIAPTAQRWGPPIVIVRLAAQ